MWVIGARLFLNRSVEFGTTAGSGSVDWTVGPARAQPSRGVCRVCRHIRRAQKKGEPWLAETGAPTLKLSAPWAALTTSLRVSTRTLAFLRYELDAKRDANGQRFVLPGGNGGVRNGRGESPARTASLDSLGRFAGRSLVRSCRSRPLARSDSPSDSVRL